MEVEEIASQIINSAIKVHRALGPGLLETAYQTCLTYHLRQKGRMVECEVSLPITFEGVRLDAGYRIDMRIDRVIIIENKSIEEFLPVHQAQTITYLKLSGLSLGFLINWNVPRLIDGLRRVVLNHPSRLCG